MRFVCFTQVLVTIVLCTRPHAQATVQKPKTHGILRTSGNNTGTLPVIASILLAHSSGGKFNRNFPVREEQRRLKSARSDPIMQHEAFSNKRIVLITGANRGIGKEIARKIALVRDHVVVLGCRNEQMGVNVAAELRASGYDAFSTHLDLTNRSSIELAHDFIQLKFGKLDALINNAAVKADYDRMPRTPFMRQEERGVDEEKIIKMEASPTIQTNYFGTLHVIQKMLPLLRTSDLSPRIVNVGCWAGRLRGSPNLQSLLTSPSLTLDTLSSLMKNFISDAETGNHVAAGWPNTCYGVSKLALIALTRILARDEPGIMVTSADPGFCDKDLKSAERGAITPSMLAYVFFPGVERYKSSQSQEATVAEFDFGPFSSGKHFYEGRQVEWSYP